MHITKLIAVALAVGLAVPATASARTAHPSIAPYHTAAEFDAGMKLIGYGDGSYSNDTMHSRDSNYGGTNTAGFAGTAYYHWYNDVNRGLDSYVDSQQQQSGGGGSNYNDYK